VDFILDPCDIARGLIGISRQYRLQNGREKMRRWAIPVAESRATGQTRQVRNARSVAQICRGIVRHQTGSEAWTLDARELEPVMKGVDSRYSGGNHENGLGELRFYAPIPLRAPSLRVSRAGRQPIALIIVQVWTHSSLAGSFQPPYNPAKTNGESSAMLIG
jgi:hypothetical protein